MSENGYNVRRIWIKHVHTVAYILIKLLELLNNKRVVKSWSGTFVTHSLAKWCTTWPWIELIGIFVKLMRLYAISLLDKRVIYIADRFLLDSIVHILISLGSYDASSLSYRIMVSFLKKYAITIFLDGSTDVLLKRKGDRADPYNYVYLQRLLYRKVIKDLAIPVIYIDTTNRNLRVVYKSIRNVLQRILTSCNNDKK